MSAGTEYPDRCMCRAYDADDAMSERESKWRPCPPALCELVHHHHTEGAAPADVQPKPPHKP